PAVSPLFPYTTLFRSRRPALRTAPAGRGARSPRGDTREPVHARLRDPCHPCQRTTTGVPDAGGGDSRSGNAAPHGAAVGNTGGRDRKSTRLNSSHVSI